MSFLDNLLNGNKPKVEIVKNINVEAYPWCNSAVLFSVKNGKASLKHICNDDEYERYWYISQLELNQKPLLRIDEPLCSTCSAILATGYGIENIDCAELNEVSKNINSEYVDLETSFEILKPLLGLLDDGIYMLADVSHYPTDGDGKFFYDISNEDTKITAACTDYFNHDFLTVTEGFPAYLYPTQSDRCINRERVDYYVELFKNTKNPPRAIAYHENGFVSALLDGHHKAVAAAKLGVPINCLTIIRGFEHTHSYANGNKTETIHFSSIRLPNEYKEFINTKEPQFVHLEIEVYQLIKNVLTDINPIIDAYPTVDELTKIYAIGLENTEITDELVGKWLADKSKENLLKLKYVLIYLSFNDKPKAYSLARRIIADGSSDLPLEEAYKALLSDKSESTEKLFSDYLANHTNEDKYWDIVHLYWN